MSLPDINEVLAKRAAQAAQPVVTGNVPLILNEIRHALARLIETGETTIIDLRRVPLSEAEETELEAALGQGEVSALIMATGPTDVVECRYPGVWRVTHKAGDDEIVAKFIEITHCPDILASQAEDMKAGLVQLNRRLDDRDDQEVTT